MNYRTIAFIVAIAVVQAAMAQIPDGYYASLNGKKGAALKTAVHEIIKNAKVLDYGSGAGHTWEGFYSTDRTDDNVVIDSETMTEDAHNNIIKLPKGKLAVINGLDGFIVAEEGNVLLICKKEDSSDLIRKYVNDVQMKRGDEYV